MSGNDLPLGALLTPRNDAEKDDWYPFESCLEFETGEFLFTHNQMPQTHVDRLMQLWMASILRHKDRSPFANHSDLHRVLDAIPQGEVPWKSVRVKYLGDIPELGAPRWMTKDYDVWYRDPNTVVANLLDNPDFHEHFDYVPYCEFEPTGERQWENFMSGNWAWCHAVCLD